MELGIETKVEGDILEKGKIALDAKLFSEIARKLSDSDSLVTIESDEKFNTVITVRILYSKFRAKMARNSPIFRILREIKTSHSPSFP